MTTLDNIPDDLTHDAWLAEAQRLIRERDAALYPAPVPQYPLKRTDRGLRSDIMEKQNVGE